MPGHYDHFMIHVDCPRCGVDLVERYGVLRLDPRMVCHCGAGFAVYLDGCPVEVADRSWDERERHMPANDDDDNSLVQDC
jgi:hypothetical protein